MGLRDRLTPPAIQSWRIVLAVGVGVALVVAGLPIGVAIAVAVAVLAAVVFTARRPTTGRAPVDPFAVGEPWRQLVQRAQSSERKLRETVGQMNDGPLRDHLDAVTDRVARGVDEAWAIACRGDRIDDAIRRLDPTALRVRLEAAERHAAEHPSSDSTATVESLRRQLDTAASLHRRSDATASSLRTAQAQLDELVARASEVQAGAVDTEAYRREVDDLVIQLEALHQAIEETERA